VYDLAEEIPTLSRQPRRDNHPSTRKKRHLLGTPDKGGNPNVFVWR
jgi:hypothetical protein